MFCFGRSRTVKVPKGLAWRLARPEPVSTCALSMYQTRPRVCICGHRLSARRGRTEGIAPQTKEEKLTDSTFPVGWDKERVTRLLEHYEAQTDDEAVAEDEAAYDSISATMVAVPVGLVPEVRDLIARRSA
jgi:hypothetical protein